MNAMQRQRVLLLEILLLGATATAQSSRMDQVEDLGFQYKVHPGLERQPLRLGQASGARARYESKSERHFVDGHQRGVKQAWYLEVKTLGLGGSFVRRPGREFVIEAKEVAAKGKRLAHRVWEFVDADRLPGRFGSAGPEVYWYSCAAVYEVDGLAIAMVARLPGVRSTKIPVKSALALARQIVGSGRLSSAKSKPKDEPDPRDALADTPEKQAALQRAKASISELAGWDYFTSEKFIAIYAWHGAGGAKRDAERHARKLTDTVEQAQDLYLQHFPSYPGFEAPYSVLRICDDHDAFRKYSHGAPDGVIGWYSPRSKELVIFRDREKKLRRGDPVDVMIHEGWHQFADAYFGVRLHAWFEEGMGDYLACFRYRSGKWRYSVSAMRKRDARRLVQGFGRRSGGSIRAFMRWRKFTRSDEYAKAYTLVDLLHRGKVLGRKWQPAWGEALSTYWSTALREKDMNKAYEVAFSDVDLDALGETWVHWVKTRIK